MTTSRIKNKISRIVGSQLPEFVSEYTTFVSFLEHYYRFLEQDSQAFELIQNAQHYSDIDRTVSSFINYFLKNYATDLPVSSLVNKRFFIKRIKDLYESKGSDLSFKLLFQILFAEEVETTRPYDLVLRASDGVWEQKLSIRVNLVSGTVDDLQDKFLKLMKEGVVYANPILKIRLLENNSYEIFIPFNSLTPFEIGDMVFVGSSPSYDFLGTVIPTTSTVEVITPGAGFKPGQIFNVTALGGSGSLVKVIKTNANSGISSAKIVTYGYGYQSNTTLSFDLITNIGVSSFSRDISSNTGGFAEVLTLAYPHSNTSASRYFDTDYTSVFSTTGYLDYVLNYFDYFVDIYVQDANETGSVLTLGYTFDKIKSIETSTEGTSASIETSGLSKATLQFNMGALARYPGEYKSSQGFISEPDVRLQDNQLYQPFAYQLQSSIDIEQFYNIVKKLIHPAGTNLFSNRTLSSTANLRSNIHVLSRSNIILKLFDTFEISSLAGVLLFPSVEIFVTPSDTVPIKTLMSTPTTDVQLTENNIFSLFKTLSESVDFTDAHQITYAKDALSNTFSLSDSEVKTFYKTLSNSFTLSEIIELNTQFSSQDSFVLSDAPIVELKNRSFSDVTPASIITNINLNKPLADSITMASTTSSLTTSINNAYSRTTFVEAGYISDLSYVVGYFNYFVDIYVVHPVLNF